MIPGPGCSPEINIIKIGAQLLFALKDAPIDIIDLLHQSSIDLGVSVDHIILSLDWLYIISTIKVDNQKIYINDIKYS
jgi:hypothetical protein